MWAMSITGHSISQWLPCPVPSWVPNTIGTWGGDSVKVPIQTLASWGGCDVLERRVLTSRRASRCVECAEELLQDRMAVDAHLSRPRVAVVGSLFLGGVAERVRQ